MGHPDIGRCVLKVAADHVEIHSGAGCMGQGVATVLTQVACEILDIDPALVRVVQPDTATTPNSGTSTASRQTLITGEACRRACEAAREEARAMAGMNGARNAVFPLALLAGREYPGRYEAATDAFDAVRADPVHHIVYSYACQLAVLGPDRRVQRIVAAHDSGLVVNPLAFEGQVEGGVVMGLGYAVSEDLPLSDCAPTARFGQLGLLRATDAPSITTILVRKAGPGSAIDGGVSGGAFGAKGIGEISTIPTAAAVAGAYFALDGKLRSSLPLRDTPYRAGP
jgi:CO/xanthine dehydrogenase Mo-binding subunit